MPRKTAYESNHKTLQKKQGNNKDTKNRVWQYLFEHKRQMFSATQVANALGDVHRTTVRNALNDLLDEDPIVEQKKAYKVYIQDTSYYILDVESYEKKKSTQKKKQSLEDLTSCEAYELGSNPNIWTAKEAKDLHAEVIFYPIAKDKRYFKKVENSLKKLYDEYIIAVLAGDKDGNSGLFIIIKPHKDRDKIKEHIQNLYQESAKKHNLNRPKKK